MLVTQQFKLLPQRKNKQNVRLITCVLLFVIYLFSLNYLEVRLCAGDNDAPYKENKTKANSPQTNRLLKFNV